MIFFLALLALALVVATIVDKNREPVMDGVRITIGLAVLVACVAQMSVSVTA